MEVDNHKSLIKSMKIDNHKQKFDVMKRFTSGKLRALSGAKPPQCTLPRATSRLTFNFCGDVHLYCLFFSLIFVILPPGRLKCKRDEIVRRVLDDLKQYGTILARCFLLVACRKTA